MTIYMKVPGADGAVNAKGHEGWIELSDVEFPGVSNSYRIEVGKVSDRFNAAPQFRQIRIQKFMGEASTQLFEAVHTAKVFPKVDIHYVSGGSQLNTYAKLTLHDAMFTHYSDCFDGEGHRPQEVLRIAYSKIERTYIPYSNTGNAGSPSVTGYDLENATQM